MAILLVRLKVQDYDVWRRTYEGQGAEMRKAAGCTGTHLFRNSNDANEVIINQQWDSVENAQAFIESDALREAMQTAGVIGQPEFLFLDDAGRTPS